MKEENEEHKFHGVTAYCPTKKRSMIISRKDVTFFVLDMGNDRHGSYTYKKTEIHVTILCKECKRMHTLKVAELSDSVEVQ